MTKKLIYIIRHGETELNRLGIVQGSGVDAALNETGIAQAEKFYQYYKEFGFNKVITSALIRTHQSVANFIQDGLPHVVMSELNEISWGDYEGLPQSKEQMQAYLSMLSRWEKGDLQAKIPNGESPLELQARQERVRHYLINDTMDKVLICMHGRAMKSFLCLLLNRPLTQMETFQHSNLCLYALQYVQDEFQLLQSNDVSHLKP
ncbi:MAG: histidine phosphatase family protein [Bacteroidetes bacterium]|nr:MAG: histidine phosphatase family protein [Bacteroidota bacterium]